MAKTSLNAIRDRAIKSGKMSARVSFMRAYIDDGASQKSTLSNETISETLQKMPGNIGDDEYVSEVAGVLLKIGIAAEAMKDAGDKKSEVSTAAISAVLDQTPQGKLARELAELLPTDMLKEMDADYQAALQGKVAPFHALRWLVKTFGSEAKGNMKNRLDVLPVVDSQMPVKSGKAIEVEVPFVSRFDGDQPAKYQVLNKQTQKFEDFDFYTVLFDDTADGKRIAKAMDDVNKRIVNEGKSTEFDTQKKALTGERNNKRTQIKNAMKAYQQMAAFNAIDGVVCKFNFDDKGNLNKHAPVYFYEADKPINARMVDMNTFLSYRPSDEKVKDFATLITSKPTKTRKGDSGQGNTGSDVEGKNIGRATTIGQFEAYAGFVQLFMEDKKQWLQALDAAAKDKPFRNTLIRIHLATESFYKKHRKEFEADLTNGSDDSDVTDKPSHKSAA